MSTVSQSVSGLFSAYASVAGTLMLVRSMANELIPPELRSYLTAIFYYFFPSRRADLTLIIYQRCGMTRNQVFDAAEVYLSSIVGPSTERLRVGKTSRQKNFSVSIEKGEEVNDVYDGGKIKLKWKYVCTEPQNNGSHYGGGEKRYFELTFDKKWKPRVMESYLHHVLDQAEKIKEGEKVLKLYNRECPFIEDYWGTWGSVNLEHPATFESVAMDPEMRKMIIDDLDRFVRRKEFYKKVGKAWKRGYLLYGPPGTGKSSLIAAMANYLKFDIYDLELTSIFSNSDLRSVLMSTTNRSILVIEDIDCRAEVQDREMDVVNGSSNTKLTLSGILNFIDGLWSSCGDERIIVFTTNNKEKLDPALLRPGRMDLHIHMSYCTIQGLNALVSNYLGVNLEHHCLYKDIQGLINTTNVTPAEIAGELMKNDDADISLDGLVKFLKQKNSEANEVKSEGNGKVEDQEPKRLKSGDDNDEKLSFNENKARIKSAARAARRRRPIRGTTY